MSDQIKTVTLPVSGAVVQYRRPRQSRATLALNLKKRFPPPSVPVMEVKVMGKPERTENYANPNYLRAYEAWNAEMGLRVNDMLTKLAIVPPSDEELANSVARTRRLFPDVAEGQTDFELWIDYVICQDDEDFIALTKAISEVMGATEEQISEIQDTFPNHV